ncbi:hypothetical protein PX699_06225 [Sphingobium sp. H39-3-25]|nr:hypothetical protein [Sphingobium arseniciresistens]
MATMTGARLCARPADFPSRLFRCAAIVHSRVMSFFFSGVLPQ